MLKKAQGRRLDTSLLDIDYLVDYFKAAPDVAAQSEGRIVILNEPKP